MIILKAGRKSEVHFNKFVAVVLINFGCLHAYAEPAITFFNRVGVAQSGAIEQSDGTLTSSGGEKVIIDQGKTSEMVNLRVGDSDTCTGSWQRNSASELQGLVFCTNGDIASVVGYKPNENPGQNVISKPEKEGSDLVNTSSGPNTTLADYKKLQEIRSYLLTLSSPKAEENFDLSRALEIIKNYKDYGINGAEQSPKAIQTVLNTYQSLPAIFKGKLDELFEQYKKGHIPWESAAIQAHKINEDYKNAQVDLRRYILDLAKDGRFVGDIAGSLPTDLSLLTKEQVALLVALGVVKDRSENSAILAQIEPKIQQKINAALITASDERREQLIGEIIGKFYAQFNVTLTADEKTEVSRRILLDWTESQETSTRQRLLVLRDLANWFEQNAVVNAKTATPSFATQDTRNEYEKLWDTVSKQFADLAIREYLKKTESNAETANRIAAEYREFFKSLGVLVEVGAQAATDPKVRARVSTALYEALSENVQNFREAPVSTLLTSFTKSMGELDDSGNAVSVANQTLLGLIFMLDLL